MGSPATHTSIADIETLATTVGRTGEIVPPTSAVPLAFESRPIVVAETLT